MLERSRLRPCVIGLEHRECQPSTDALPGKADDGAPARGAAAVGESSTVSNESLSLIGINPSSVIAKCARA